MNEEEKILLISELSTEKNAHTQTLQELEIEREKVRRLEDDLRNLVEHVELLQQLQETTELALTDAKKALTESSLNNQRLQSQVDELTSQDSVCSPQLVFICVLFLLFVSCSKYSIGRRSLIALSRLGRHFTCCGFYKAFLNFCCSFYLFYFLSVCRLHR